MTITETLTTEHKVFCRVFGAIEEALPSLATPLEIQTMARVVESMLRDHARCESQTAFLAFDRAKQQQGCISLMHEEHRELDARLIQVHRANTCAEARRLLRAAIASAREHFAMEEKSVFPLIEKTVSAEVLQKAAEAWIKGMPCQPGSTARTTGSEVVG